MHRGGAADDWDSEMTNLPPGVEPHDSDPPEQKPLAGWVTARLEVEVSYHVHGSGHISWSSDECYTREHLDAFLRVAVDAAIRNHSRLTIVEAQVTGSSFEPD